MSVNLLKQLLLDVSDATAKGILPNKSFELKPDPTIEMEALLEKYSEIWPLTQDSSLKGPFLYLPSYDYTHYPLVILMSVLEFLYHKKRRDVEIHAPNRFSLYLDAFFELIRSASSVLDLGKLDLFVRLVNDKTPNFPITLIAKEGWIRLKVELPKGALSIKYPFYKQLSHSWGSKAVTCELGVCKLLSYFVPESLFRKLQYFGNTTLSLMTSREPSKNCVFHCNRILLKIAREKEAPPFLRVAISSSYQWSRSWMRLASGICSRSVELIPSYRSVHCSRVTFYTLDTKYFQEVRVFGRKETDDVGVYSWSSHDTTYYYEEEHSLALRVSDMALSGLKKLKKVFGSIYS